jgi:Bifunctional DNA primase/polymerase, N-terminal
MTARPSDRTVERALAYAGHGWPVFPCQPGGKEPATRHGFLDATTDPDKITWWWRRQPEANLAIATGQPGPDVLDVDQHGPAGNGFAAFNQLQRAGLTDGASALVATPSGGLHAYFAGSDQRCAKLPRHHLDFRAQGGYIVAPPSEVGGRPYQLISHRAAAAGLDWSKVTGLLEPERHTATRPAEVGRGGLSRLATWVGQQHEGNRNDGLFWAACRAAEASDETVLAELAAAARSAGLSDREIAATISSARRTAGRSAEHQGGREAGS